eukprot:scaffold3.g6648.t1
MPCSRSLARAAPFTHQATRRRASQTVRAFHGRPAAARAETDARLSRREAGAAALAGLSLPALLAAAAAVPATARAEGVPAADIYERSVGSVAVVYDVVTPKGGGVPTVGAPQGSLDKGGARPGARVAKVLLSPPDGSRRLVLDGILVGADRSRDLAVLKVDQSGLAPLPFGDSALLRVGQPVLAIGAPFGFENTLTGGGVSALNRGFQSQTGNTISGGIQTDAPTNPGSSGGPLLDAGGRVVGINTAIFGGAGSASWSGLGFALPINAARRVVDQLIQQARSTRERCSGRVARASLGIQPAPEGVARALGIAQPGLLVQAVTPGSAADRAGLLGNRRELRGVVAGDLIVSAGGRRITSQFDLSAFLDECVAGQEVELVALRGAGGGAEERVVVRAVLDEDK